MKLEDVLTLAAMYDRVDVLKGYSFSAIAPYWEGLVITATVNGNAHALQFLLDRGDKQMNWKHSLLILCSRHKRRTVVEYLVNKRGIPKRYFVD